MSASLDDAPVEEHQDLVGAADRGEAVRDEHDHAVPTERSQALEEVPLGSGVERGGRLVHHHERRVAEEGPRRPRRRCHWPTDSSIPSENDVERRVS